MEDKVLQHYSKLENILNNKYSTTIIGQSTKSEFNITFPIPLNLDPDYNYELGLLWYSCYNTIYNITKNNNQFIFNDKVSEIVPGAYEIVQLNNEIQRLTNSKVKIEVDIPTTKSILLITKGNSISFTEKSFHKLLGFKEQIKYDQERNVSENIIQIIDISTINIECSIINGAYKNGKRSNIIHSFPSNTVPLGYKFIERISPPIYLPIFVKAFDNITIRIIDQNGNLISFNGEEMSIYLHLKQV